MDHVPVHRDAHVTNLLDLARSASRQSDRLAAYREFERVWLGEDAALVPLCYERRWSLTKPWIHGFWQNALAIATWADVVVER